MKFRHLIIHLDGKLDENLGLQMFEKIQKLPEEYVFLLLDFSGTESIEKTGLFYIQKLIDELSNKKKVFLALTKASKQHLSYLQYLTSKDPINVFDSIEEAKTYLTNQYYSLPEISKENKSEKIEVEPFIINCPKCKVKLRVRANGNHACPSCSSKFQILPDKSVSLYEKFSLET